MTYRRTIVADKQGMLDYLARQRDTQLAKARDVTIPWTTRAAAEAYADALDYAIAAIRDWEEVTGEKADEDFRGPCCGDCSGCRACQPQIRA